MENCRKHANKRSAKWPNKDLRGISGRRSGCFGLLNLGLFVGDGGLSASLLLVRLRGRFLRRVLLVVVVLFSRRALLGAGGLGLGGDKL